MIDWNTGPPNARYWVLKLPGDTDSSIPYVYAQGFAAPDGKRKVLLVNKRDRTFELSVVGVEGAECSV